MNHLARHGPSFYVFPHMQLMAKKALSCEFVLTAPNLPDHLGR
jgi:hypothetical protein